MPSADPPGEVLATLRDKLFGLTGGEFPLEVVLAETIAITAGGKGVVMNQILRGEERSLGSRWSHMPPSWQALMVP
ncbi:hypothetical protein [Nonomuraea sp. NPDC049750]|uniref:hypothetical protein n=1 Tax=Nonomuraea sp. NPDC049750 TaxID=3154738 RepID=UPI003405C1D0